MVIFDMTGKLMYNYLQKEFNMKILKSTIIVFGIVGYLCLGTQLSLADEPTIIVFLTWKPNQPEVWKHLFQKFHRENPGVRVKVQVGPPLVHRIPRNRDPTTQK